MPFAKKKLNENEKKLAKEYIKRKFNKKAAALAVYDVKPQYASGLANQVLKREHVKEYVSHLLDQSGLTEENLADYTKEIIATNLTGKPSQAVAGQMIQFAFKLHNALPPTKSMSISAKLSNSTVSQKDFDEVKKQLADLQAKTQSLLETK